MIARCSAARVATRDREPVERVSGTAPQAFLGESKHPGLATAQADSNTYDTDTVLPSSTAIAYRAASLRIGRCSSTPQSRTQYEREIFGFQKVDLTSTGSARIARYESTTLSLAATGCSSACTADANTRTANDRIRHGKSPARLSRGAIWEKPDQSLEPSARSALAIELGL